MRGVHIFRIIAAVEYHGYPGGSRAYGALKAALVNWVGQLAIELAPKGIRANAVSPGPPLTSPQNSTENADLGRSARPNVRWARVPLPMSGDALATAQRWLRCDSGRLLRCITEPVTTLR